jgi:hypothetical protein
MYGCVGELNPVPRCQFKDHLRFQRAFDVDMQFCFRHVAEDGMQLFAWNTVEIQGIGTPDVFSFYPQLQNKKPPQSELC